MPDERQSDAIGSLLFAAYGITAEQVLALPQGAAERLAATWVALRDFENAAKDLITVAAATDSIPPGEESLRLALIAAVQTVGARQWTTAATGSDDEFQTLRRGEKPWVFELLSLLRATRRPEAETDAGRWFMLHGLSHPTRYREAKHQALFESVVRLARESLTVERDAGSEPARAGESLERLAQKG